MKCKYTPPKSRKGKVIEVRYLREGERCVLRNYTTEDKVYTRIGDWLYLNGVRQYTTFKHMVDTSLVRII